MKSTRPNRKIIKTNNSQIGNQWSSLAMSISDYILDYYWKLFAAAVLLLALRRFLRVYRSRCLFVMRLNERDGNAVDLEAPPPVFSLKLDYSLHYAQKNAGLNSMKTSRMKAQVVNSRMLKKNEGNILNINHFPEQNHETSKKEESKELVDAENGVAKVMSTDTDRKPPINNHKPTN